ncbi:hypothetical protein HUU59_05695 [bacterium]|nr:hypothetical protein [bacterium]
MENENCEWGNTYEFTNFRTFLECENLHERKNQERLGANGAFIDRISDLFLVPIRVGVIHNNTESTLIAFLWNTIHERYLLFIAHYLRSHQQDAYSALRHAIDASFVAFLMIKRIGEIEGYTKRHREFKYAKQSIEEYLKAQSSPNLMLSDLVRMHELCSQHGSHADFIAIMNGRFGGQTIRKDRSDIRFDYFQYNNDDDLFIQSFLGMLNRFLYIQELFVEFWQTEGLNCQLWSRDIKCCGIDITRSLKKHNIKST